MGQPKFQLAQGDAVAWLRTLPAASIDLVITDPPYESLEKHRAVGTTTRLKHSKASSNDWFAIFPNDRFPELFSEVYRVLKRDTHFYLFCDPETMFVAKPIAEKVGFKFWKPLIWDKCLGPDTLVWTERGTVRIADVAVGDRVAIPEGGSTRVRAVRRTRAPAVRLHLSDGTELVASRDHRFMRSDGTLVEAAALQVNDRLLARAARLRAGPFSDPEPAKVDAIAELGVEDLVDISVEDRNELFLLANGVVTHNCRIGMGYHYRARYECVLFFEKGKRKLNDLGIADVIESSRIVGGYPAEKPPAVSEVLVTQSSEIGQLVIDPFMGSGSVGVAAIRHERDFLGNDLCLEAGDIARSRLVGEGGCEGLRAVGDAQEATEQLGLTL
jgi:DNA modification methylase